uniref:Uncharacterized protein n=1 Tax=Cacopsylla melanoneura TaxID=428564 RepID=A0A8D8ZEE7_9HEMI
MNLEMHEYCPQRQLNVDLSNTRCIQVECALTTQKCLKEVCICAFVQNDEQQQQSYLRPYLVYEIRDDYHIFNYAKLSKKPYDENSTRIILPDQYFRHPLRYFKWGDWMLYRQLTGYISVQESDCKKGTLRFDMLPPIP